MPTIDSEWVDTLQRKRGAIQADLDTLYRRRAELATRSRLEAVLAGEDLAGELGVMESREKSLLADRQVLDQELRKLQVAIEHAHVQAGRQARKDLTPQLTRAVKGIVKGLEQADKAVGEVRKLNGDLFAQKHAPFELSALPRPGAGGFEASMTEWKKRLGQLYGVEA
jgi:hypothetical protein